MVSLGRSSAVIAVGTLASRITGLVRNIALVGVIGSVGAADAFTNANQLPNNVFMLISAGVLTAVFVPQIVAWSARDDGGLSHIARLMTLGTVVLAAVTLLAFALVVPLIFLSSHAFSPGKFALAVAFAVWCVPQIFFYGVFALMGETLNARGRFAPYAWAPVTNNVIGIVGFTLFAVILGGDLTALADWQHPDGSLNLGLIALLGGLTTLGVVAQAVVLAVFWKRAGLPLRPDFHWRGMGLRGIGTLAGWTFLAVIVGQVVSYIQQGDISPASSDTTPASTVWFNSWLLFMLPYSLIVMSIGTPYFTQLSRHVTAGEDDEVRSGIPRAMRMLALLTVLATAAMMVAAVPAARVFSNDATIAVASAPVLIAFLVGLVPLAVQFVVQRTFYAYGDTRTPFWFTVLQGLAAVAFATTAVLTLTGPDTLPWLTPAVALGQSLSSLIQVVVASLLLRRRIGSFGMSRTVGGILGFIIAALPAAGAGYGVYLLTGGASGWMVADKLLALVGCGLIAVVVAAVYGGILTALRVPETRTAVAMFSRLLKR